MLISLFHIKIYFFILPTNYIHKYTLLTWTITEKVLIKLMYNWYEPLTDSTTFLHGRMAWLTLQVIALTGLYILNN